MMGVQSHVEGRFGSIKAGCNRPWPQDHLPSLLLPLPFLDPL